ncbi:MULTISPECIES: type IV pilus biogenesis/stability protein PilW [Caldimonas]|uniref:type IV pilus biogenesis/stability protein PilW n=1 Tax=Caldimonas TaxID=196013 RepID=UPI000378953E|nr:MULTISPECIES: type IV pilus biogenesis/stability protein PilW [Caldimonas]MCX7660806.1 type IV pilus biogenesis/stability protein PilW [Caldimonas manganoxidans]GIX25108.1 MAG: type IV pilus biogenesis/stability protein PilW [Caldimonas sp.]
MSVRQGPMSVWLAAVLSLALLLGACASAPPSSGRSSTQSARGDDGEVQRRARIRFDLAVAYFGQGQHATALNEVRQALALQPNMADAHNLAGLIHAALGQAAAAEDSFNRAMQLDPRDGGVVHNYGWFLCQQRRYADAFAQFDRALAMPEYRDVTRTLVAKGVCQANAGQVAEAEKTLSRAYELDPSNPVTAMNLAMVLYREGEYERARFYVRRVNAVPELVNAESLWLAARIEHRLGNRGGANELGRELRQRFPQSREAANFERGRFDD